MNIICFLPFSEIDWGATGSMLGGICGLAAIIVTIIIAVRQSNTNNLLAQRTNLLSENQIKISLFERRFQIYESFCELYDYFENWIIKETENSKINDEMKHFCTAFNFKIEEADSATEDMFHNITRVNELKENIKKVKFTYENREIDYIIRYFDIVLDEVYLFCKQMGSISSEYKKVLDAHKNVKTKNIKELMEKELVLENSSNNEKR